MPETSTQPIINIHRNHAPEWFKKADFGIFIHWGLYSVPAFAPAPITKVKKHANLYQQFKHQPYAEWYANTMMFKNGPTAQFHRANYGDAPYSAFAQTFKAQAKNVDVDAWAEQFAAAGAKYVVVVTKHHDGFVMYDTAIENPNIPDYHLDFDFVGQLAQAVRAHGMRFGVYYSSLLDWTFKHERIQSASSFLLNSDHSQEYLDYVFDQWHELIDRYKPDILWSDIGYPEDWRLPQLFADYYEAVPEGMVNDRWGDYPSWMRAKKFTPLFNAGGAISNWQTKLTHKTAEPKYYDYRTLEYNTQFKDQAKYYEITRGIDLSFGYNKWGRASDFMTATDIKKLIDDAKPNGGRLLLDVGPMADGTIPPEQSTVLNDLNLLETIKSAY